MKNEELKKLFPKEKLNSSIIHNSSLILRSKIILREVIYDPWWRRIY
jgi:hypothetical protein